MSDGKRILIGKQYVDDAVMHLRERMEQKWETDRIAREARLVEVEAHMKRLNGEAGRIAAIVEKTVTTEKHDLQIKDLQQQITDQGKALRNAVLVLAGMILTIAGWLVVFQ